MLMMCCVGECAAPARNFVIDVGDVDDVTVVVVDVVVAVCQDAGPSVVLLPQLRDLTELLCID